MVLDALIFIKNELDPTLTFRRSCREGRFFIYLSLVLLVKINYWAGPERTAKNSPTEMEGVTGQ